MTRGLARERSIVAGPLRATFAGGELRDLEVDGRQILRRVAFVVRDRDWKTVPAKLTSVSVTEHADGCVIDLGARHLEPPIDFAWQGRITATHDGALSFAVHGRAQTTFLRNRIGLCVLFPTSLADLPAAVTRTDGREVSARFPGLVDPHQPVAGWEAVKRVTFAPAPGVAVELEVDGEEFELEDQRNWTDASFKLYGTPLRLPHPVEVAEGTVIDQSFAVQARTSRASSPRPSARDEDVVWVRLEDGPRSRLPQVGLGFCARPKLDAVSTRRLAALAPRHVRVDWSPRREHATDELASAVELARSTDARIELAVKLAPGDREGLERLHALLRAQRPPLARVLVHAEHEPYWGGAPLRSLVEEVRAALGRLLVGVPVASGTNSDFIFFGRNPPPADVVDAVTFAVNPQVHASDDASIVETLQAQGDVVRTAATTGLPVVVSPVTLRARHNPYATAPASARKEAAPESDPRQGSLLCAAWTVGSLAALSSAGAASVTFFELAGARGILEPGATAPTVFPVWHVFADLAQWARSSASLLPCRVSDPAGIAAIAIEQRRGAALLIANLRPRPARVRIAGITGLVNVRVLDAHAAAHATKDPEGFRELSVGRLFASDGTLSFGLDAHAYVHVW